jgi:hypothetical protein
VKYLNRKTNSSFIKFLIKAGLVFLPYSHFKWLPDLGTTRPLSSVIFVITFGFAFIYYAFQEKFHPVRTIQSFYYEHLVKLPGWHALKFWLVLIGLGTLSALITPFYGNFFQALNRLLGYWIIFGMLYCGYYAIQVLGIHRTSWWIGVGYIPVLMYAVIESLAILNFAPALSLVLFIRRWLIVDFLWVHRLALFTTEPSFIAFQLLLLVAIVPFLANKFLRISTILLVALGIIFSKSGTVIVIFSSYLVFWILFSLKRSILVKLTLGLCILVLLFGIAVAALPGLRSNLQQVSTSAMKVERLRGMYFSSLIRSSYTRNLIYALIETRGLGLGIGQYGQFWKDIYLRHIDYHAFDILGEVTNQLNSSEYMRPWSVILGIGSDLGILGMIVLGFFFYFSFKPVFSPHGRAVILAGIIAMLGAYPIVTPHVWLAIAMMTAHELQLRQATK